MDTREERHFVCKVYEFVMQSVWSVTKPNSCIHNMDTTEERHFVCKVYEFVMQSVWSVTKPNSCIHWIHRRGSCWFRYKSDNITTKTNWTFPTRLLVMYTSYLHFAEQIHTLSIQSVSLFCSSIHMDTTVWFCYTSYTLHNKFIHFAYKVSLFCIHMDNCLCPDIHQQSTNQPQKGKDAVTVDNADD